MGLNFTQRIKAIRAEVEALKTASRSDADGMNTVTKTITFTARLVVHAAYVSAEYFLRLIPRASDDKLLFSISQAHVVVSDDIIVTGGVPRLKNNQIGAEIIIYVNYQRQQWYLDHYNEGDIIERQITIKITASDDFTYSIEEDN